LPVSVVLGDGTLHVTMPAATTPEAGRRIDERHDQATVAGLRHVLAPESVVLIGASERPGSVGDQLLANILDGGYLGALHLVHPRAAALRGVAAVSSVAD